MANKKKKKPDAPDYKSYPKIEDIYYQDEEVSLDEDMEETGYMDESDDREIPLEDFSQEILERISIPDDDEWNTENFDTDHTGDDLDVPGAELDDDEEEIGEEDEENNYYSLGGPRKRD